MAILLLILRFVAHLSKRPRKQNTIIILGSGGHTTEMFKFLDTVPEINSKFFPRHYVIADTDKGSEAKVHQFEHNKASKQATHYHLHRIPRSREVGQSYLTSVFTTLRATLTSFRLVWSLRPDVVLANGPGTCVPICISAWLLKLLGRLPHCYIALSESYACVSHVSLTTKLLYPFVNVLFVQWSNLLKKYPKAVYSGRIPFSPVTRKVDVNEDKGQVLVTVGTTLFKDLIKTVDSEKFGNLLNHLGYKEIHIQYGSGPMPSNIQKSKIKCVVYDYKPSLSEEISASSLIIGHAGVGTIFEALEEGKFIIAVPNPILMNNHQAEIAKEMEKRGYIKTSTCATLYEDLKKTTSKTALKFPKTESPAWYTTLSLALRL
uniref:UDP-N-acetylglucosamine transferase subunit ALG14 n=1 Tax=Arcella intermedia TaxID=1963864 RepID=A0A6B2L762_9EUKA